ncbi:hypothetical protein H9I32_21955 [Bacillus sp. Xin]|uniref:hypothetical protein n=1 Tax=unclassified Bacillus (in: firmicutes) TaxID=185979 RepID=UPI0015734AE4|nr:MULTISPECIES: hypothetical protein [unclassified Bacillus (in: firmicutes)]MBC6974942.1 hypothetical protein [Bacillus sp. Xin]NSW38690.1 hypothetical protein [Bacillus sp. Xin1]
MLDKINGYLLAMEQVNHMTNHGYTFHFHEIVKQDTILATIQTYFEREYHSHEICNNYGERLQKVLDRWFFEREFYLKYDNQMLHAVKKDTRVQTFLELLDSFFYGRHVITYEVQSDYDWYVSAEHFVFELEDKVYVLELGVND